MSNFVFELPVVEYFTLRERNDEQLEVFIDPKVRIVEDEQDEYYLSSLTLSIPLKKGRVDAQIHQVSRLGERSQGQCDSSSDETVFLVNNLFSIIERLVYETTEIIYDEKGVELIFTPEENNK